MQTELYKCFKAIDINNLVEDDKQELIKIFMITGNTHIRNQIAFIFSDCKYNEAIPFIIKKINEKELYNNNGSLVYSLQNLDINEYFIDVIKIICEQDYEARLMAFDIIIDYSNRISETIREELIKILDKYHDALDETAVDQGENSTLHFIEQTKKILKSVS